MGNTGRDINIDPYSVASRMLEMRRGDVVLSHGTVFFWRAGDGGVYLVTNWHNVTGINPLTGDHLHAQAAEPDRVVFSGFPDGDINRAGELGNGLYGPDDQPEWLEHPQHGRRVDVVCLRLPDQYRDWVFPINTLQSAPLRASIAGEAFVIGFPGRIGPERLPIWKRASIASEPDVDVGGLPLLYVDTASSAGMSGSPVLLRAVAGGLMENGVMQLGGIHTRLLGVYSGRLAPEGELRAQLGHVWKARVIEEIINGARRGHVR